MRLAHGIQEQHVAERRALLRLVESNHQEIGLGFGDQ
jgi:hypothetical protein